jgi:hypothetical protein
MVGGESAFISSSTERDGSGAHSLSASRMSVMLPFMFMVAIKSRVARRPSHERLQIWESRPRGRCRKTGDAGPNIDPKIGRYTGCTLAGGHELGSETRCFLFVLLADFSMLRLEVIEALMNNVEFIDLAGRWNEYQRWFEIGRVDGRVSRNEPLLVSNSPRWLRR